MSLSGKYISSFEIVRNVIRDSGSVEIPWQDAIEWIADCMDMIGAPHSYRDTVGRVIIDNFRGTLPCDFESMIQCSGLTQGCRQFPMRESTDNFHPIFSCGNQPVPSLNSGHSFAPGSNLIDTNTPIGEDSEGNPTFNFMNDSNVTLSDSIAGSPGSFNNIDQATYKLNDGFIFTSFKDGAQVLISYKARPIDKENGFPLVPDNIKFKEAIKWCIIMKIDYILWRRGDISKDVYNYSEQQYMWYVGAAATIARTPSIDKMESWKNQMLHLIPKINKHSTFFKDLGSQERLTFGRKINIY